LKRCGKIYGGSFEIFSTFILIRHTKTARLFRRRGVSAVVRRRGLNITEMCVDRWQTDEMRDQPAIIWEGEEGEVQQITYAELQEQVEFCAAGLRVRGHTKGDAIGIHLPMMIETVVALLAINRIGAIAVPVFSGYGIDAIASRMNAVGAKVIFTCNDFARRGKQFDAFDVLEEAAQHIPTLEDIYVIESGNNIDYGNGLAIKASLETYEALIGFGKYHYERFSERYINELSNLEPTNAEDPLIILYTSGRPASRKASRTRIAAFQ
jgi:acetyl-CoA synthetase